MSKVQIIYLQVILLFTFGNVSALDRNFAGNRTFCASHAILSEFAAEVRPLLKYIPVDGPCFHIECQKCGPVTTEVYALEEVYPWAIDNEEYEDEEDIKILMCRCKRKKCSKSENFLESAFDMGRLSSWKKCTKKGIYSGYFSEKYQKYFHFFKKNAEYTKKYKDCTCFWPEANQAAAKINNQAYQLFRKLFQQTAFAQLVSNERLQRDFFELSTNTFLNLHGVTIACICHCQHFSDYYQICNELESFARNSFDEQSYYMAQSELLQLLDMLYPLFIDHYTSCLEKHAHNEIEQEKQLIQLLLGQSSKSVDIEEFLISKDLFSQTSKSNNQLLPNLDFLKGICFNESLLYEPAIRSFNAALEMGVKTRDIYIYFS